MLSQKHVDFDLSNKITVRECKPRKEIYWAHYTNAYDRLRYCNSRYHTLSMYFKGGFETHRTDIKSSFGGPGKFCLMPKESESRWQLGAAQEFMHLYFDDDYIKQLGLEILDLDPRNVNLPEQIFCENPLLQALFNHQMQHVNWFDVDDMSMQQLTDTVLVKLLEGLKLGAKGQALKGGLAPKVLSRVIDYIQTNFSNKITLSELATIAGQSDYHFCRMFKQSMAFTPQGYLTKVRCEHAKYLLKNTDFPLSEIALLCGFNNQSHLGRHFKAMFGITPAKFKKW